MWTRGEYMKRLAAGAVAILFGMSGAAAIAQTVDASRYPARAIRVVVPFGPGGPADLLARTAAQKMSEGLGQQVVIENRGGANGILGTEAVARRAPDGYTLGVGTTGTHGINASMFTKLPYDTINDFAPIARLGISNYVLVAHPSLPVRMVKELLQLAKGRPGQLTWAAGGSVSQLAAELFKGTAGIEVVIVLFKGEEAAGIRTMRGASAGGCRKWRGPHARAGRRADSGGNRIARLRSGLVVWITRSGRHAEAGNRAPQSRSAAGAAASRHTR